MLNLFATLAQAVVPSDKLLPTTLGGWITTIVAGGLLLDRVWNRSKKEGVDEATLNGIGGRVTAVENSTTTDRTRIDELIRRADQTDGELRAIVADISELKAIATQMLSQGTDNKLEIISEFQRIANEVRTGFHLLDVKVERMAAVADERERVRTTG